MNHVLVLSERALDVCQSDLYCRMTHRRYKAEPHRAQYLTGLLHQGGPLNPGGVKCTQQKLELFTDPTDGVERWAFTLAVVEGRYNPKHFDAEPSGYYAAVVDKQSFTLVFDTIEDLNWQLQQVAAAH